MAWLLVLLFGMSATTWAFGQSAAEPGPEEPSPAALSLAERIQAASYQAAQPSDEAPLPPLSLRRLLAPSSSAKSSSAKSSSAPSSAEQPAPQTPAIERSEETPSKPQSPPAEDRPLRIPLAQPTERDNIIIQQAGGRLSLTVRDVPLNRVLMLLAQHQKLNIVCADNVTVPISVNLEDVPLEDALTAIVSTAGCTWTASRGIIFVTSVSSTSKLPAEVQGREVRVFRLDYASATDVDTAVKSLLSPVGQSSVTTCKTNDNRKTQEIIVVYDLPSHLRSIERYIAQVDQPPRQVLIEAHVLAVRLQADNNSGVNFTYLFQNLGRNIKFDVTGFANANAMQAFFFSFDGTDLDVLLEALRTQTNAKTLASPKVLVLNGQEARIQVGQQLGYRVTTTTETSTMENVNFLDVGVVLRVTPRIGRDNQILMQVKPEVSKGKISTVTGLPESDTTEVETHVMLPDGRGMVVGGLIQERDIEDQQKVPLLGDLWLVGRLFQRRQLAKERHEIIIMLLPRIAPTSLGCSDQHAIEVQRAATRLFQGPLDRVCRPWEPDLPDARINPFRFRKFDSYTNQCVCNCTTHPCVHEEALYGTRYYESESLPGSGGEESSWGDNGAGSVPEGFGPWGRPGAGPQASGPPMQHQHQPPVARGYPMDP